MPTEQLDKTKHDKILVLNDPDITDEALSNIIDGIKDLGDKFEVSTFGWK